MQSDYVWIVLDTETTGLSPEKNLMVEVACCPIDNITLEDVGEYDSLIKIYDKTKQIQQQALDANGLTLEDIANGKDSKVVIEELIQLFKKCKRGAKKPIVVGHNVNFDIGFLVEFFNFHNKNILDYVDEFTWDTMWLARLKWVESSNYKLGTCITNAGLELTNAHRAITDTRATKELFKAFIRSLRSEGTNSTQIKKYRHSFEF